MVCDRVRGGLSTARQAARQRQRRSRAGPVKTSRSPSEQTRWKLMCGVEVCELEMVCVATPLDEVDPLEMQVV